MDKKDIELQGDEKDMTTAERMYALMSYGMARYAEKERLNNFEGDDTEYDRMKDEELIGSMDEKMDSQAEDINKENI